MHRIGFATLAVALVLALVLGTFVMTDPAPEATAAAVATDLHGTAPLDGMSFASRLGPSGEPGDIDDLLVFENGLFVSTECESRCDYPARPYFVREVGDAVEFVSETRCPYKDATIVWRGRVEDGVIRGEATWTMNRWYWSVETRFWFEGRLVPEDSRAAVDG